MTNPKEAGADPAEARPREAGAFAHKSLAQLPWERYPVRVCRSLHHCEVCGKSIVLGESYRDGGFSRRAHVSCLEVR